MKNLITISAPSGTGKTTLCKALQDKFPDIKWSISYTTRKKRNTEEDGIDYYFILENKFKELIDEGYFLEWEKVHGNFYGTSKETVLDTIIKKNILLIEMDVKGALLIKKLYPNNTFSIFIIPPSVNHLRNRLIKRGTDSIERINIRLQRFQKEMEYIDKFDQTLINKDLKLAKNQLIKIINNIKKGERNGT
ncbi:MAG: guanylate kinase [Candidatus Marinimicrobia bacterium]|nr:guanylate kinase [Candidatus Neomarinimicrobiota bacterium]|tara:strand:- start:67 stop:642 length:576 start_codon:yes stop_codon:yes gene_type:complete